MFDLLPCKRCDADLPQLDIAHEGLYDKGKVRSYRLKCRVCGCGTDPHADVDACKKEWNEREARRCLL